MRPNGETTKIPARPIAPRAVRFRGTIVHFSPLERAVITSRYAASRSDDPETWVFDMWVEVQEQASRHMVVKLLLEACQS